MNALNISVIKLKFFTSHLYGVEPELRLSEHFTNHDLTVFSNIEEIKQFMNIETLSKEQINNNKVKIKKQNHENILENIFFCSPLDISLTCKILEVFENLEAII